MQKVVDERKPFLISFYCGISLPELCSFSGSFKSCCCFNSRLCRHLSLVLFYLDENSIQDYESDEKFLISDDRISHLLPTSYQDMIVRVYSKKPELVCGKKKCYFGFITISLCIHSILVYIFFFNTMLQVGAISEAFENFQVKTYGIKAQVHATPEKKIRRR